MDNTYYERGSILMKIIDRGIVFKAQKDTNRQSCAFPGICVLPSGRWICTFRAAPKKEPIEGQHVLLTISDDMGKTWTKPTAPFPALELNGKYGLIRGAMLTSLDNGEVLAVLCWVDHSEPRLAFFNEDTEGLLDTQILLSRSLDYGESWSRPEKVNPAPFDVPVPITGPILALKNGELACQFELNKHYYDTAEWRHSSVMIFSKDRGKSWYNHSIASNDPENRIFYWDQRPGVLNDGRILNLFWTFDRKEAVYLNIHARESLDNGKTWSEMWDTGVPGQPAPPISISNNGIEEEKNKINIENICKTGRTSKISEKSKIAMVYVDRTNNPMIKLRLSEDKGRTWPEETELTLYDSISDLKIGTQTIDKKTMQDAWSEMGKFSVGLPTTALLKDGTILTVYYSGIHTDLTNICWVRVG